jgi:hypothetical protein
MEHSTRWVCSHYNTERMYATYIEDTLIGDENEFRAIYAHSGYIWTGTTTYSSNITHLFCLFLITMFQNTHPKWTMNTNTHSLSLIFQLYFLLIQNNTQLSLLSSNVRSNNSHWDVADLDGFYMRQTCYRYLHISQMVKCIIAKYSSSSSTPAMNCVWRDRRVTDCCCW